MGTLTPAVAAAVGGGGNGAGGGTLTLKYLPYTLLTDRPARGRTLITLGPLKKTATVNGRSFMPQGRG